MRRRVIEDSDEEEMDFDAPVVKKEPKPDIQPKATSISSSSTASNVTVTSSSTRCKEFSELVETRYTLILCLNRRAEDWGVEFTGGFFKELFKEFLTLPSGTQIATLQTRRMCCLLELGGSLFGRCLDEYTPKYV